MATIQWRPTVNAITKPRSYSIQIVPRNTSGYDNSVSFCCLLRQRADVS